MPHNLTIAYLDADTSAPGLLYLPGEPCDGLNGPREIEGCELCELPLATLLDRRGLPYTGHLGTGWHAGVVEIIEQAPLQGQLTEYAHLRCLLDAVELGSVSVAFLPPVPATAPVSLAKS